MGYSAGSEVTQQLMAQRLLAWRVGSNYLQDCFLPKGSYVYPSSVIIFFMKINFYREVSFCLSKQNIWTHKLRKAYCFKRLWSERNDWIWLHLFIRDMSFVTYHPSNKQIGHFIECETVYCNFRIATWLRVWAVLFSLPGSIMGRETVYLCYDLTEVLQAGETWMKTNPDSIPFSRLART